MAWLLEMVDTQRIVYFHTHIVVISQLATSQDATEETGAVGFTQIETEFGPGDLRRTCGSKARAVEYRQAFCSS